MNRNIAAALAVAAAAVAGNSFADDITIDTTPFVSTKSRAEVRTELAEFKASGVNPWSRQYNPLKAFRSTKTRQQVVAEYVAARAEVAALNSEDGGSAYLAQQLRSNYGSTLAGQPKVAH